MHHLLRRCGARTFLCGLLILLACSIGYPAVAQESGSKLLQAAKKRFKEKDSTNTRVIGGEDTTIQVNPWQVGLLFADDKEDQVRAQFCGGVIVHPQWVLTAAHCVDSGTLPGEVEVLSGTDVLIAGQGTRLAVESITVHTQWDPSTRDFDIALVKVKSPLASKPIAPALDSALLAQGAKIWVSGWGVTEKRGAKTTRQLQGVSLDFIAQDSCNGQSSYNGRVTDSMFCAGIQGRFGGGGKDSCQGDSGGPASIGPVESARLVGLVSWGEDCALPYKYGVYTRVPKFLSWVTTNSNGQVAW
jgi:secreted trypsin-like serine protease